MGRAGLGGTAGAAGAAGAAGVGGGGGDSATRIIVSIINSIGLGWGRGGRRSFVEYRYIVKFAWFFIII